jgi:ribosomal protein S18 acetylase RimI-like enzyme
MENSPRPSGTLDITIRKGSPEDADDFVRLASLVYMDLFRAVYGISTGDPLKNLFRLKKNHLSFEHSSFACINGEIAGVIMGTDWRARKREWMRTRILMLRYIGVPFLVKLGYFLLSVIESGYTPGMFSEDEYYIGYLVVYPQFRGLGLGKKLILKEEDNAKKMGAKKMVADVDITNKIIIKLVRGIGYTVEEEIRETVIGRNQFKFFRISKYL